MNERENTRAAEWLQEDYDDAPFVRVPIPRKLRFAILTRDKFTCLYCGAKAPSVCLEVDHIVPVSKGGTNGPGNLVSSCRDCNQAKRDELLEFLPEAVFQIACARPWCNTRYPGYPENPLDEDKAWSAIRLLLGDVWWVDSDWYRLVCEARDIMAANGLDVRDVAELVDVAEDAPGQTIQNLMDACYLELKALGTFSPESF